MKENRQRTNNEPAVEEIQIAAATQMNQDFKNALLIVSVVANLFIFIGWLVLQATTQYDAQIAHLLFNR